MVVVRSLLKHSFNQQETQGVCVASFQCPDREFPAFYTRSSGCKAPYNFESAAEAAKTISVSNALSLNSGILIAVPVPVEHAIADGWSNLNDLNLPST